MTVGAPSITDFDWVEPQDTSNAVLFQASEESRYVTGLQLKVDAGAVTRQPFPGMGVTHG
jgi:NAD(P)-dependent dehydrogenase (short-subunit alcohol dehydrogenase family)